MNHTADREIALRCAWFLIAKFGTVHNIQKKTNIGRQTFYAWKNGDSVPSAYWLQYLVQIGADSNYLLTGRKMLMTNDNKALVKDCSNCVYYDTDRNDQPCCTCENCLNWEESEVQGE